MSIKSKNLNRIVILGSHGFVGSAICSTLDSHNYEYLPLSRNDIDLSDKSQEDKLLNFLKNGDILVAAAAVAPVKNIDMFIQNLKIINTINYAASKIKLSYFLNIGSDAVYEDSTHLLTDKSIKAPSSLHGAMHLSRLIAFENITEKQGTISPTLIYGPNDPHNGYGPNQFCRLLNSSQDIKIFGKGEERRDHIYINDVANIAFLMIKNKIQDNIIAATGNVISFKEIAEKCIKIKNTTNNIISLPRNGPMPHNGYRAFDITKLNFYFNNFKFTSMDEALSKMLGDQ